MHRNVVFRDNADRAGMVEPYVTQKPYGSIDPLDLYAYLEQYENKTGGSALAIAHNGKVYAEICKGMYGLLQAGCITHAKLILHLAKHGYSPCKLTPGPWRHEHHDITFCLGIDNFGVKYTKKEDADHLIQTLREIYTCTID